MIGSEVVPNISRIQSLTFVVGIILSPDKLPDFPSVDKHGIAITRNERAQITGIGYFCDPGDSPEIEKTQV